MIQIENTNISADLVERFFTCDIAQCRGLCCVEGEAGAPLEKEEYDILRKILPAVWDDLSPEAKGVINKQGVGYVDAGSDIVTSIVNGKNCVFTYYDTDGTTCKCAIEKAYKEGRTDFLKPVSCHLYPVRVTQYKDYMAVNLHRWKVCRTAEILGVQKRIRVYQFLREPLIRKFGEEWYNALDTCAKEYFKL
ncbi:MAG: DUF3109 family protein [Tannerella sp.]|nr:DUF3109 family protein [Tannerella sp.]